MATIYDGLFGGMVTSILLIKKAPAFTEALTASKIFTSYEVAFFSFSFPFGDGWDGASFLNTTVLSNTSTNTG